MKEQLRLGKCGEEYVKLCYARRYLNIRPVPDKIDIQLEWGDIVLPGESRLGISQKKIEVKTEAINPNGNFFMELWSNRSTGREGWLKTSPADELFYLFWNELYGFRFPCWQQTAWIIDYNKYNLVKQKAVEQNNDTWGYLVPQGSLSGPFAPIRFMLDKEVMQKAVKNIKEQT